MQDKSPVLGGKVWNAPRESRRGGGMRDVLEPGGHASFKDDVKCGIGIGTRSCAGLECLGLEMGVHWDKQGHRVGMHGGAGLGQECLRMHWGTG